jgi:predicted RNA-binding protein with TRAM domain
MNELNIENKIPVKVGEILKLGIRRFGKDGTPIMIHKGYIIFLKDDRNGGVELNRIMEIKVMKVFPKYAFAERTE